MKRRKSLKTTEGCKHKRFLEILLIGHLDTTLGFMYIKTMEQMELNPGDDQMQMDRRILGFDLMFHTVLSVRRKEYFTQARNFCPLQTALQFYSTTSLFREKVINKSC